MASKSLVFKWHLKSRQNCPVFRCLVTVQYSDLDLNSPLLVRYSDHGMNNGTFDNRTGFNHSNTRLVCNWDRQCMLILLFFAEAGRIQKPDTQNLEPSVHQTIKSLTFKCLKHSSSRHWPGLRVISAIWSSVLNHYLKFGPHFLFFGCHF